VRPGDALLVPGGTVHAIGAGVTLLEVQQNSDTTYRIWDWGRVGLDGKPRETHVEKARECVRFGAPLSGPVHASWARRHDGLERARLARSEHFAMNALNLRGRTRMEAREQPCMYAVIEGDGRLAGKSGGTSWPLRRGDVWLVPASFGAHEIEPTGYAVKLVELFHHD
jgi:mannose-6-phosphate isomerase